MKLTGSIHEGLSALNDNFRDIAQHRILSVAGEKCFFIFFLHCKGKELYKMFMVTSYFSYFRQGI